MNLTLSSSVIFLDDGHGLVKGHHTILMSNWILDQQFASLKLSVCEDGSDDDGKLCSLKIPSGHLISCSSENYE